MPVFSSWKFFQIFRQLNENSVQKIFAFPNTGEKTPHSKKVKRAKGLRIDSRAPARLAFQAGTTSLPRFSQKLGSLLGFKSLLNKRAYF
jgi:hypothetical protein